jgi:hypothetical protein
VVWIVVLVGSKGGFDGFHGIVDGSRARDEMRWKEKLRMLIGRWGADGSFHIPENQRDDSME